MKIIVIGSIAAGVSAASRLSAGEREAQITVYEAGAFYSCGTGGLPHYLAGDLPELYAAIQGKERELAAQNITARLRGGHRRRSPSGHRAGPGHRPDLYRRVRQAGCGHRSPAPDSPGAGGAAGGGSDPEKCGGFDLLKVNRSY